MRRPIDERAGEVLLMRLAFYVARRNWRRSVRLRQWMRHRGYRPWTVGVDC